jgi:hypothetical protein
MGRKRRYTRPRGAASGTMSSMRGGFRSVVTGGAGQGAARSRSGLRRWFWNLFTLALLLAAALLVLRRFGLVSWP